MINKQAWGTVVKDVAKIDKAFLAQLRQLCHPDRHDNSKLSQVVSARLNEIRKVVDK